MKVTFSVLRPVRLQPIEISLCTKLANAWHENREFSDNLLIINFFINIYFTIGNYSIFKDFYIVINIKYLI